MFHGRRNFNFGGAACIPPCMMSRGHLLIIITTTSRGESTVPGKAKAMPLQV
jgi:hypothetical protein